MASDEDIYFDEPVDDGEGAVYAIGENAAEGGVPAEEDNSPQGRYARGKEQIGFENSYALTVLTELFNDTEVEAELRAKALCRLSQLRPPEDILETVGDVFKANSDGLLSQPRLEKTLNGIATAIIHSEAAQKDFFKAVSDKIDRTSSVHLFLDFKLRQAELYLRFADYSAISEFITDALQFCPMPPDRNNAFMCRCAIRILILQIEVADHNGREDRMFDYYARAQEIPVSSLTPRQQATLTRLEGMRHLHLRNFAQARTCFWDSFKIFNEAGVDKRLHCLQYCALAALCAHEQVSVFFSPEANPLATHPITAPIAQLWDAYLKADIVEFNSRLDSARKSLQNDARYAKMLDEVRIYVLERNLKSYCLNFEVLDVKYAAKELTTDAQELEKIVEQLIIRGELQALIDGETRYIWMKPPIVKSPYLQNIELVVEGLERIVGEIEKGVGK
jgi:COP9 signalosome complex subunit 2